MPTSRVNSAEDGEEEAGGAAGFFLQALAVKVDVVRGDVGEPDEDAIIVGLWSDHS